MTIIRKTRTTNYSMIYNVGLKDPKLSAKAKGLLAYMLTLPDDWKFYQEELEKHFTDGTQSIRTALNELIKHGYLVKKTIRDATGKFTGTDWIVYDNPLTENHISVEMLVNARSKKKSIVKSTISPSCKKPFSVNHTLLRTNNTKDLILNNNSHESSSVDERKLISKKRDAVFDFWESNGFGVVPSIVHEQINEEIMRFKEMGIGEAAAYDLIRYALKVTVLNADRRSWRYVQVVLNNYRQQGITSVTQAKLNEQKFKQHQRNRRKKKSKQNWETESEPYKEAEKLINETGVPF